MKKKRKYRSFLMEIESEKIKTQKELFFSRSFGFLKKI